MKQMLCFFKRKTAYEMRISDWSSVVCSSDLITIAYSILSLRADISPHSSTLHSRQVRRHPRARPTRRDGRRAAVGAVPTHRIKDRKSVVLGKSVSVRQDLGG